MLTDVVIAARNEAATIKPIINTFTSHPGIGSVIVAVDADTTDNTWEVADTTDCRTIITGTHCRGKGQVMMHGLARVTTERIIFCDADLFGLTRDHVSHLLHPTSGMVLGVPDWPTDAEFDATGQPRKWKKRLTLAWAMVTGQRCVPTQFARDIDLHGYLAETQMNVRAIESGLEIIVCELRGLHSPFILSDQRLADMERDRQWGMRNGWLPDPIREGIK